MLLWEVKELKECTASLKREERRREGSQGGIASY
jgi:hypothetical protein